MSDSGLTCGKPRVNGPLEGAAQLGEEVLGTDPDRDERPHICNHGWISIASIVVDEETGEETEEYALYLSQRCVGDKVERG
jgi:hypothetical protein